MLCVRSFVSIWAFSGMLIIVGNDFIQCLQTSLHFVTFSCIYYFKTYYIYDQNAIAYGDIFAWVFIPHRMECRRGLAIRLLSVRSSVKSVNCD